MKATQPDKLGHFGDYGGMYVPETLMEPLNELTKVFKSATKDPEFKNELNNYLTEYVGRPTPLYFAEQMTKKLGSKKLAAAIHPYDMTCRPHILNKHENKDYERLIMEFGKLSGIYALLNTSFNLHGFPIINTLSDAINILKKSNLDGLLLKECLIIKR